ncbi:hypothetical protein MVEN_00628200 [Mycena venus]|uniref:Uncharacterized protein n=1 Tax=Mycena venus TaxID=2733690 RepID=A0A8H7D630_9AGAR|nr:hypothetical protein MVEN_00628200 [Mycena venus]
MAMHPVFPLELEREIFETAAFGDRELIPTLLRVCQRVHTWVEPLLYRVLLTSIDSEYPWLSAIQSKPASFLQKAVHHVYLRMDRRDTSTFKDILLKCSGVRNLVLDANFDPSMVQVVDNMRLQRLGLYLPFNWTNTPLPYRSLSSLTHLEIYSELSSEDPNWTNWLQFASLPALTHVCLSGEFPDDVLPRALVGCPSLIVGIVAFWDSHGAVENEAAEFAESLNSTDPRVVVMVIPKYKDDWESGARGGSDFWMRAEAFVLRKRKGEIEAKCYYLDESDPHI